jgi:hypothetical protein
MEQTDFEQTVDRRRANIILAVVVAGLMMACVGNHPKACIQSSDCQPGGFCDGQGFCDHECRQSTDCPCGSSCNRGCGLCLRSDTGALATCYAIDQNVSEAEALGACQSAPVLVVDGATEQTRAFDTGEGGACLPPPRVLSCAIDAGAAPAPAQNDAGMDAAPPQDAASTEVGR